MSTDDRNRRPIALVGAVCVGLIANLGGWAGAWTFRGRSVNAAFVRVFEFGVVILAVTVFAATVTVVVAHRPATPGRWSLGLVLGVLAGLGTGACAAYWPWFVAPGF